MHLRLLPEKGKYKFRGVKMEMLVTKFSNGKYRKPDRSRTKLTAIERIVFKSSPTRIQPV